LRLLRALIGLALGVVIWTSTTTAWDSVLAAVTEPLLRIDSRFRDAELVAAGNTIDVRARRGSFPLAIIPAAQLTFNTILLFTLFASNPSPLRARNLRAFLLSLLIVLALQPLGLLISIESTYALRLGDYSETHYTDVARDVWLVAEMFWRLVGMFGIAFAAWWIFSSPLPGAGEGRGKSAS
jgi:hypothetical protein